MQHLHVFGCAAYAHIPKDERKKLNSKSKCVLVGYGEATKSYRLYNLSREKIVYSRDVVFNEIEKQPTKFEYQSTPQEKSTLCLTLDFTNDDEPEIPEEPKENVPESESLMIYSWKTSPNLLQNASQYVRNAKRAYSMRKLELLNILSSEEECC